MQGREYHARGGDGSRLRWVQLCAATIVGILMLLGVSASAQAAISNLKAQASAYEGIAVSGEVGTFDGTSPIFCSVSNYNATIDWGNGQQPESATVEQSSSCSFRVKVADGQPPHVFDEEGSNPGYTLQVTGPLFDSQSAHGTVAVNDAKLTPGASQTLTASKGNPVTGVVATFTDANPKAPLKDFSATIDWGDGSTPTPGTLGAASDRFTVTGTHTYSTTGTQQAKVTINDVGGQSTTSTAQIKVVNGQMTADPAPSLSAVEGNPISGTLASFKYSDPAARASGFTAVVDWNDGSTPSPATVAAVGDHFEVTGSHMYPGPGDGVATVTITDAAANTVTVQPSVTVTDAPLTLSALAITATVGTQFDGAVATFTDAYSGTPADHYVAFVDWGDGSKPTQAAVSPDTAAGPGHFTISASHTYATTGNQQIGVAVGDLDGGNIASGSAIASVIPPAPAQPPVTGPPGPPRSPPVAIASPPQTPTSTESKALPKVAVSKPRFGPRGTVQVDLSCPAGGPDCRGELRLVSLPNPHAKNHRLRRSAQLGSALFLLKAGASERVDLRLPRDIQRLISHAGTIRARALATAFGPGGSLATASDVASLRVARPGQHSR